ncbi:MAG: putative toxin-antitoxin system toxin component, PIN family [Symploca sp. SIO1C2]|nr:putative toxin-antitoxin system toxin component, PIN family [Symploca sp. SIO1C2]
MKILFDTNVLLDALLNREPFVNEARTLMQAVDREQIIAYVTATTLTDIFYIVRKHTKSYQQANQALTKILSSMEVCQVDRKIIEQAIVLDCKDFEDAIQIACAIAQPVDAIVSRNLDLVRSSIPILSPLELCEQL